MSVYGKAVSTMTDIDRLERACRLVMGEDSEFHKVTRYEKQNGTYRSYSGQKLCGGGGIRGTNAALVIHGGLDNSAKYGGRIRGVGGSGDTAFVIQEDGSIRIEHDLNWHSAPRNMEAIKNLYALIPAIDAAKAAGDQLDYQIDEMGKVTGTIKPNPRKGINRASGPVANRATATRRQTVTTRRGL